ncbi:MAG: EAL domain-containing protein [Clostridia bacterium]|nr:EAL domain-containing protein [Clostridia bacterium]
MKKRKIKNLLIILLVVILIIFIISIYLKIVINEKNKVEIILNKINMNGLKNNNLLNENNNKNSEQLNYELNNKFNNIIIQLNNLEKILKEEFNKIIYLRLLLIIFISFFTIILLLNIYEYHKIKKQRKNMYKKIKEKNEFKKEFEKGIKNKEFKMYVQPRYDTATEKIIGGEVLVRWHKNNKIIYPNEFIKKLEENNLIKKLDLYLLNEICKKLEEWKNNKIKISINQSQKNILDKNYINEIKKIINKYNFDHSLLEIELTEDIFIENKEKVKSFEKELHSLNIGIAIDDFGTGYSSYNLLNEIKIDVLKLDKKLFDNLEDEKTKIIIRAIINMTKELKIDSVAEGIESEYQLKFLKEIECKEIQGYYFSKPKEMCIFENELKNLES